MRINKYIAKAGIASRRGADEIICQGRVRINERIATLGDDVGITDTVTVDGVPIVPDEEYVYVVYHKPYGVIVTEDASLDNTIVQAINYPKRIFPVGRLDVQTSGLILLTNDGSIVNKILKADQQIPKEYIVKVDRPINLDFMQQLEKGVVLGDWTTLPAIAQKINKYTFSLTIVEGKNRQVRRMCEALGYKVQALHRIRIGKLMLDDLSPGEYREISRQDVRALIGV